MEDLTIALPFMMFKRSSPLIVSYFKFSSEFISANKIDLYGFNSDQLIDQNYTKIIDLFNKGVLIKNLIKPQY